MSNCPPFVSVVVPVRNAERTLADCIRSLLRLEYPATRREILIVDNSSTDASATIARGFPIVHVSEPRRGPSHARNTGIQRSHGDVIAFTDADCIVTSQWLRGLIAAFEENDVDAVAGEILPFPPQTWAEYYMAERRSHWQRAALGAERPYIVTANVAFRRKIFERIGLFDPRFPTGQDQDLSWRFFRAGLVCRYAPTAIVFHRHRSTTWQFFKQQLGWGRGVALLRRYHRLPWGLRRELGEYRRLVLAAALLLVAAGRVVLGAASKPEVYYRFHDLLREVARRISSLCVFMMERHRTRPERAPE
jgi:O-antigen biosynthesis protein